MFLRILTLGLMGLSFGFLTAGGVFTVLLAVGLIPRFAGKTHTGRNVVTYENMVIFGTLTGNLCSVFDRYCYIGKSMTFMSYYVSVIWKAFSFLIICGFGLFAGIFVGSLAMAIAEMLDSIPIFARRIGFRHGMGIAVAAIAAGKLTGSLIYFSQGFFHFGG